MRGPQITGGLVKTQIASLHPTRVPDSTGGTCSSKCSSSSAVIDAVDPKVTFWQPCRDIITSITPHGNGPFAYLVQSKMMDEVSTTSSSNCAGICLLQLCKSWPEPQTQCAVDLWMLTEQMTKYCTLRSKGMEIIGIWAQCALVLPKDWWLGCHSDYTSWTEGNTKFITSARFELLPFETFCRCMGRRS